jgi:hypothetical protein
LRLALVSPVGGTRIIAYKASTRVEGFLFGR